MPQTFYGRQSGFGLENDPGTPVEAAYALSLREFVGACALRDASMSGITDLFGDEYPGDDAFLRKRSFSLSTEIGAANLEPLMKWLFGDVSFPGPPADSAKTATVAIEDGGGIWRFAGSRIERFTIASSPETDLVLSAGVSVESAARISAAFPLNVSPAGTPIRHSDGTFHISGQERALREASISVSYPPVCDGGMIGGADFDTRRLGYSAYAFLLAEYRGPDDPLIGVIADGAVSVSLGWGRGGSSISFAIENGLVAAGPPFRRGEGDLVFALDITGYATAQEPDAVVADVAGG